MGKNDRTRAILDRAFKDLEGVDEPAVSGVRGLLSGAVALIDSEAAVTPTPPIVRATPATITPATPVVPETPTAVPAPAVATAERALPLPTMPPRIWNSVEERRRKLQESSGVDRAKVGSSQADSPNKGQ